MNSTRFALSESDRAYLRNIVRSIDRELSCLGLDGTAEQHDQAKQKLALSWALLVDLLAVDAGPEVPEPPVRKHVCMSAHCERCARPVVRLPREPGAKGPLQ